MRALRFNHVSIAARDLEESVRFYEHVFGMERIPTYTFGFPVQYLRLGEQQLHLFERDTDAPTYHHIGLDVDDFESAYERASSVLSPPAERTSILASSATAAAVSSAQGAAKASEPPTVPR